MKLSGLYIFSAFLFLMSGLLFLAPPTKGAAVEEPAPISVTGAFSYATVSVQKNGGAFLSLTNDSDTDDQILSAASDIAERAELHTHVIEGDIIMMRKVESFGLPAGETLTLEPMGDHIMLFDLKAPLKAGESFPLTLTTEHHGDIAVSVEVKGLGGSSQSDE